MRYKMMKKKLTGYDAMYYFFRTFAPFYVKNCGQMKEYKIAHRGLSEGIHTSSLSWMTIFLIVLMRQRARKGL